MRNKTILILLAAFVAVQCCCVSSLVSEFEQFAEELPQEMTLDVLPEEMPTIMPGIATPTWTPLPAEPSLDLNSDPVTGTEVYTVRQTLRLVNEGSVPVDEVQLRMALIRNWAPYQEVLSMQISPAGYEVVTDRFDNQYAEFWLYDLPPGESILITLDFEVAVHALDFDLSNCTGEMIPGFTAPEKFLESDSSEIQSMSLQLSENAETHCQAAANIYDHVIDSMEYTGYVVDDNGALQAYHTGEGDCTDYADLMIALTRAAGIPARFVEGVTYGIDGYYAAGQTKHDWLEVYLPETGWVPMDPTWGEEQPARYYAGLSPDHIVITKGRNLEMLDDYHYWAYWWGDIDQVEIRAYDESWQIWKQ